MSFQANKNISFFRRELPQDTCTSFHSKEGKSLFTKALLQGNADAFFPLVSYFSTQSEPAFCALTTLIVILNALEIDPGRLWKWPWRFWNESHLDCCLPLSIIEKRGVTLPSFLCIARCNGVQCTLFQPKPKSLAEMEDPCKGIGQENMEYGSHNQEERGERSNILEVRHEHLYGSATLITKEEFRNLIISKCKLEDKEGSSSVAGFLVLSYSRKALKQTGDGHFSPIGLYEEESDSVLILDVARFKYEPHFVSVDTLYESIKYIDPSTGKCRGIIYIEKLVVGEVEVQIEKKEVKDNINEQIISSPPVFKVQKDNYLPVQIQCKKESEENTCPKSQGESSLKETQGGHDNTIKLGVPRIVSLSLQNQEGLIESQEQWFSKFKVAFLSFILELRTSILSKLETPNKDTKKTEGGQIGGADLEELLPLSREDMKSIITVFLNLWKHWMTPLIKVDTLNYHCENSGENEYQCTMNSLENFEKERLASIQIEDEVSGTIFYQVFDGLVNVDSIVSQICCQGGTTATLQPIVGVTGATTTINPKPKETMILSSSVPDERNGHDASNSTSPGPVSPVHDLKSEYVIAKSVDSCCANNLEGQSSTSTCEFGEGNNDSRSKHGRGRSVVGLCILFFAAWKFCLQCFHKEKMNLSNQKTNYVTSKFQENFDIVAKRIALLEQDLVCNAYIEIHSLCSLFHRLVGWEL